MDWFSWVSKTGLDPSLVYEYGFIFAHNELEKDDIAYFTHDFLQSMGISIGKHRLEILKLATKEESIIRPVSRVLVAIKPKNIRISKYFQSLSCREESALAIVPCRSYNDTWKNTIIKRNKKSIARNKPVKKPLLLTNAKPAFLPGSRINRLICGPLVHGIQRDDQKLDDEYLYSCDVEEIRWDTMFKNLKPT